MGTHVVKRIFFSNTYYSHFWDGSEKECLVFEKQSKLVEEGELHNTFTSSYTVPLASIRNSISTVYDDFLSFSSEVQDEISGDRSEYIP